MILKLSPSASVSFANTSIVTALSSSVETSLNTAFVICTLSIFNCVPLSLAISIFNAWSNPEKSLGRSALFTSKVTVVKLLLTKGKSSCVIVPISWSPA